MARRRYQRPLDSPRNCGPRRTEQKQPSPAVVSVVNAPAIRSALLCVLPEAAEGRQRPASISPVQTIVRAGIRHGCSYSPSSSISSLSPSPSLSLSLRYAHQLRRSGKYDFPPVVLRIHPRAASSGKDQLKKCTSLTRRWRIDRQGDTTSG